MLIRIAPTLIHDQDLQFNGVFFHDTFGLRKFAYKSISRPIMEPPAGFFSSTSHCSNDHYPGLLPDEIDQ